MTESECSVDPAAPAVKGTGPDPQRRTPEAGQVRETGGPKGPEPTRYGDWEKHGRCIDF